MNYPIDKRAIQDILYNINKEELDLESVYKGVKEEMEKSQENLDTIVNKVTQNLEKDSDCYNQKCSPHNEKLTGKGVLSLIQDLLEKTIEPLHYLEDSDFDDNDSTVEQFKKDLGGVKGVSQLIEIDLTKAFSKLQSTRKATRGQKLREVFSHIHKFIKDKDSSHQIDASVKIAELIKDSNDINEFNELKKIKELVLSGNHYLAEAAGFRTKQIFSNYRDSKNIKLAYYMTDQQVGEPFLLCPKAKIQIGHALPIAIHKCVDYCVDSQTSQDGKVTCKFAEWLNVVADNNESVNKRMEKIKHSMNEETLGSIPVGERSAYKGPVKSYEQMLEDVHTLKDGKYGDTESSLTQNIESRLNDKSKTGFYHRNESDTNLIGTQSFNKSASKKKNTIDPEDFDSYEMQLDKSHKTKVNQETIEKLLEECRTPLEEQDLDVLTQMLADHVKSIK